MKYKVVIGWRCEFIFDDGVLAMAFLEVAAKNKAENNNETIRLEVIEPEEQADETDETV